MWAINARKVADMNSADFDRFAAQLKEAQSGNSPGSPSNPLGAAPSITIGTVTTGNPGSQAMANITGTSPNFVLNLTIPEGDQGEVPTIGVGNVVTLPHDDDATVTLDPSSGPNDYVFHFGIPRGDPGPQGDPGAKGDPGQDGIGGTVGMSLMLCMASTGAKNNAEFNLFSTTYSRQLQGDGKRHIFFQCDRMTDAWTDCYIRVNFANSLSLTAFAQIVSIDSTTVPNRSVVHAVELYGVGLVRGDIVQGHINDGTAVVCNMQMNSNNQSWFARVNSRFNGALRLFNASIGSTNSTDWQNQAYWDYLGTCPHCDFGIGNYGIGNDVTEPTLTAEQIFGNVTAAAIKHKALVDELLIIGEPGARLNDLGITGDPTQSVEMATLQVLNEMFRNYLAPRYAGITYINTEKKFLRPSIQGFTSTADMVAGQPPSDFLQASGPHWIPAGDDQVAESVAEPLIPKIAPFNPFPVSKTDFIFVNSVPDLSTTKFNPNGIEPWCGNMPTVDINVLGVIIGTGIEGMVVNASGINADLMSGVISLVEGEEGFIEVEFDFTDKAGGASFEFQWHGTNAHPLKNTLNDARFRGIDVDAWFDHGFYGQNSYSLYKLDVSLWGVWPDGTHRRIASWFTDVGNGGMFESQGAWVHGINGIFRAGDAPFRIPTDTTFTDAYIAIGVTSLPLEGFPMGQAKLRWGQLALRNSQRLATPLPGRFA